MSSAQSQTPPTSFPLVAVEVDPKAQAADLQQLLHRAREERFRLARTLKDAGRLQPTAAAAPAEAPSDLARVTDKLAELDAAIQTRMAKLDEVDAQVARRLDQLGRLEDSIRHASARFAGQVEHSRSIEHEINDAADTLLAKVNRVCDDVLEEAARQLDRTTGKLSVRVHQADEAHSRLNDQLDTFRRQSRAAEELVRRKGSEVIEEVTQNAMQALDQQLIREKVAKHIQKGLASLADEAVEGRREAMQAAVAELTQELVQQIDETIAEQRVVLDEALAHLARQAEDEYKTRQFKLAQQYETIKQQMAEQLKRTTKGIDGQLVKMDRQITLKASQCAEGAAKSALAELRAKLDAEVDAAIQRGLGLNG